MRIKNNMDRFLSDQSKANYKRKDLMCYLVDAGFQEIPGVSSNHWKYVHSLFPGFVTIKKSREELDPAEVREVRKLIRLAIHMLPRKR